VVVSGRREEEGSQTERLIHQLGAEGRFVRGDVSKSTDVEAMVRQFEDVYGRQSAAYFRINPHRAGLNSAVWRRVP